MTSTNDYSKIISSFTVYKILRDIVSPFTQMKAYSMGVIDKDGNYLKTPDDIPVYDRLVIGIKKLINRVPDPPFQAKMRNISTSLALLGEEVETLGGDKKYFINEMNISLHKLNINIEENINV
jgi:hypothetical protein|tara:strand:+ start:97 stop:465 length:369 start_codon:yes stop_codon:yes gene_type:complete